MVQLNQSTHDEVEKMYNKGMFKHLGETTSKIFWLTYQNASNEWRVKALNSITKKYHNAESQELRDFAMRCDYAYSLSNQFTIVTDLNGNNMN